jgi:LysM repeat protein
VRASLQDAVAKPKPSPVPLAVGKSLYRDVLLAAFGVALSLILGAGSPATAPSPTAPPLPPTQPGTSHDEGWFLFTTADDGSRVVYFIAGNTRHSILPSDVQLELRVNPLWPERQALQDEVLAFPEAGPIGSAKAGLLGAPQPADPEPAAPQPEDPHPVAPQPADPQPAPVDSAPVAVDDTPAAPAIYTLHPGDNLTHIARDYGTTVDAILAANGMTNANRIYAGQSLMIPSADGSETASADAPDAPAAVAEDDSSPAPVADQSSVADSDSSAAAADPSDNSDDVDAASTYTVVRGDSAIKIARRFGIDEGALLDANGISNPNRVYVGQVLTIPS